MMKKIASRVAAAALAVSATFMVAVPAFAQRPYDNGQLEGPPLFRGQQDDYGRYGREGDWRRDDWRGRPDYERMVRDCSRTGIQEAWRRGYYSAQFITDTKLYQGRTGWELTGKMRMHGPTGYKNYVAVCWYDRGGMEIELTP